MMLPVHDLALFVVSGLLLNITPGADTLYIVSHAAARGVRGGVVAALGIGAGCLGHVLAAAAGLSALLVASATAFTLVKWAGAAYLVWLGLTLLVSRASPAGLAPAPVAPVAYRRIFLQGALTNLLNPKVALFFLAFLPQFVTPGAGHQGLAFLFLGLLFDLNGTLWNLLVAVLAARAAHAAARMPRAARLATVLNRAVGALFVVLGARLALAARN